MKAPAFQFYPADWLSSPRVILMTPEQEGAYLRLLCYDWSGDGIPDQDQSLAALSRLGEGWFKGASELVKGCFIPHPTKPGFITNERLQKERNKQKEWRDKSREGGIRSAESRRKRSSKGGSRVVQPNANRTVEPKVNSISSSSSSELKKVADAPTLPFASERFAEVWEDWKTFRKEKKCPLTPSTIKGQFKKFSKWGERVSIQAIEQSIENGWQGLFEPKRDTSKIQQQEFKASDVGI